MTRRGQLLREAREAASVSLEMLSRWASVDMEELRAAEEGTGPATAQLMDRCARVFGLRLQDLAAGEAPRAPMTLWLRSSAEEALDERAILTTEVHEALGEFQRCVRDVHELESLLRERAPDLPVLSCGPCPDAVHLGDHRARCLRTYLGAGNEPLASMRTIAERLGVRVVWVTEDDADRLVDGACVRVPRPAILVNVLEPGRYPWRGRITLAHELGHLLFDLADPKRQVFVSAPSTRSPHRFEELEQVARAFAACFLAPTEGVRDAIRGMDPTSEQAVRKVGSLFGVGRTVAINRLHHVFGLSSSQREAMERRLAEPYRGEFDGDQPPEPLGFRGQPLVDLVRRALEAEAITEGRARSILGIPAVEPLKLPDLVARDSLVTPENRAIRTALAWLEEHEPKHQLVPGMPERDGSGWRVPLFDGGIGAQEPRLCGTLWVGSDGVRDERRSAPSGEKE